MATSRPLVYVIGTGGSISCIGESRTDFLDYGYADRHYTIEEMLARLPELAGVATVVGLFLAFWKGVLDSAK